MHETITLSTGEKLIVERKSNNASQHSIKLWTTYVDHSGTERPDEVIATVLKDWHAESGVPKWHTATLSFDVGEATGADLPRLIEILQHAAEFARQLDKAYPAGQEVT